MKITRIIQASAVVAVMALGAIFASSSANAWCEAWDNRYEYDCWGKWIDDKPDLYSEGDGDPFTISGGNHSHGGSWHFTLEGTRTPGSGIPDMGTATYRGDLFGRAGSTNNDTSHIGMLYPVTGDVQATADFDESEMDVSFRNIQIHRITTGMNPVDLPDISFNDAHIGNNGGFNADLVLYRRRLPRFRPGPQ